MAHLLAKLGKEALKPKLVDGVWHKASISAKNAARLRKEALLAGQPWEFDEPRKPLSRRKPKGHKHDKLKLIKDQEIAQNVATMDQTIAKYKEEKRKINIPLIDRLLLTPKQQRLKARTG